MARRPNLYPVALFSMRRDPTTDAAVTRLQVVWRLKKRAWVHRRAIALVARGTLPIVPLSYHKPTTRQQFTMDRDPLTDSFARQLMNAWGCSESEVHRRCIALAIAYLDRKEES